MKTENKKIITKIAVILVSLAVIFSSFFPFIYYIFF